MVIKNNENDFCQQKCTVLQIKSAVNYNKRKKNNTGNCRVLCVSCKRNNKKAQTRHITDMQCQLHSIIKRKPDPEKLKTSLYHSSVSMDGRNNLELEEG